MQITRLTKIDQEISNANWYTLFFSKEDGINGSSPYNFRDEWKQHTPPGPEQYRNDWETRSNKQKKIEESIILQDNHNKARLR